MAWNKPKKVITNILVILSIVSLLISITALITMLVWSKKPDIVNKIDQKLPNFYVAEVENLYEKVKKEKTQDGKYTYHKKLNKILANISSLDIFYKHKQESNKFLIKYYIANKENEKALNIVTNWVKDNEHDFEAKFLYGYVLSIKSNKMAEKYYSELYKKHSDISEVAEKYISFLIDNNQMTKALKVENEFNSKHVNLISAQYKVYYLDKDHKNYSENATVSISNITKLDDNSFKLLLTKNFDELHDIRFDINNAPVGTIIKKLNVQIKTQNKTFENITLQPKNHIHKINNSLHKTTGRDPFYYVNLPQNIKPYSGKLTLQVTLTLNNQINIAKFAKNSEK